MKEIVTDEAGRLPGGQGYVAQAAIGVVVTILEPLQVGLDDALEWERKVTTGAGAPKPISSRPDCLFLSHHRGDSFFHLFDQSTFIEHILCARFCLNGWGYELGTKQTKSSPSWSFHSSARLYWILDKTNTDCLLSALLRCSPDSPTLA